MQLVLRVEKAALARGSDEVWIDSPQIETLLSRHGGNGLNRRVVARDALPSTNRSDHTFPAAGNSGLQSAGFGLRKNYDDDSHEPEIFAARNW